MSGLSQMPRIAREVAERHGVTVADIIGPRKRLDIVRARHEAYALCYDLRGTGANDPYSLPRIGHYFKRDHTSILYGLRRHRAGVAA